MASEEDDVVAEESARVDRPASNGIDRLSPVPLYHQLDELLRQQIDSGTFPPGSSLPSEGEICAMYGVSRSVVRQALTNLSHGGLIRTERGRGSFVSERKLQEGFVQRPTGLHDDLRQMGYAIMTKVLVQQRTRLPRPAREALGVEEGIQLDRVRSVEGRALAFIRNYLRADRCPGLEHADLENGSLYAHLAQQYNLRPRQGRRTVEAVLASGDIARHLEVAPGEPLLLLRSSSTDQDGEPLEWYEAWHRGDRTTFAFDIESAHSGSVSGVVLDDRSDASRPEVDRHTVEVARQRITAAMADAKIVAVLRAPRYDQPAAVTAALVEQRLPVVEFALTGANALEAISQARAVEGSVVGAYSVFDGASARAAIEAGAAFLVAPIGAADVVVAAGDVPVILAGMTPSEVWDAWTHSRMPVKIFPASVGGPDLLRAIRGPMPNVPLLPSGGIDASNAMDYLDAGAMAVYVGGALCPADALARGDVAPIAERAASLRAVLDRYQAVDR